MSATKIAECLRDIMTTVADKFGEPAGLMFDMSVLNQIQKEYSGAVAALDSEVSELRALIVKLQEKIGIDEE